jgi:hypothetical protein
MNGKRLFIIVLLILIEILILIYVKKSYEKINEISLTLQQWEIVYENQE